MMPGITSAILKTCGSRKSMTVCPGIVTHNRKETDECQKIEKKTETQNKTSL